MYISGFLGQSRGVFKGRILNKHPENDKLILFKFEASEMLLWVLSKFVFLTQEEAELHLAIQ